MASTSKAFKKCLWIRVLVIWHPMTHTIVASFVWAKSTHAVSLRGQSACTVSCSLWESSVLVCPSFRGKRVSRLLPAIRDPPRPRHGGEWNRGARRIWPSRPGTRVSRWIMVTRSLWRHLIRRLVLWWVMPRKSRRCLRVRKLRLNSLKPSTAPLTTESHLWACRSLMGVWVPSHSGEWVFRPSELAVGRASFAPLT